MQSSICSCNLFTTSRMVRSSGLSSRCVVSLPFFCLVRTESFHTSTSTSSSANSGMESSSVSRPWILRTPHTVHLSSFLPLSPWVHFLGAYAVLDNMKLGLLLLGTAHLVKKLVGSCFSACCVEFIIGQSILSRLILFQLFFHILPSQH